MTIPEEQGLDLVRFGTRFASSDTERRYAEWQVGYAVPFNRVGVLASIATWLIAVPIGLALAGKDSAQLLAFILLVVLPTWGFALLTTYKPSMRRFMQASMMLANCVAGFTMIDLFDRHLGMLEGAVAATCAVNYFGFVIFRLRPAQSAIAVAPYMIFATALVLRAHTAGKMTAGASAIWAVYIATIYSTGFLVSLVMDVISRQSYRQSRIVEAQRVTIASERARVESLLKQEVSHQVAARSRELGQMLQRIEASFVVGRLSPGTRFDDRYTVKRALGAGGMGVVYEVLRTTDDQRLALKLVTGEVSGASAVRFAREAEIGARIRHPHVVSIVDVGISSGAPFLVMEMADRGSLEDQRASFGNEAWARPILAQIAAGVAALHEAGVVHRDLKPGNVLFAMSEDGDVVAKISDFGISRLGSLDDTSPVDPMAATAQLAPMRPNALTATGALLGTPFYMAPESGRGGRTVGAPADVFAFGIIACEVLTGRPPFRLPTLFATMAGEELPAPILEGVPEDLRALIVRCLAEDPAARLTMKQVRDALKRGRSST